MPPTPHPHSPLPKYALAALLAAVSSTTAFGDNYAADLSPPLIDPNPHIDPANGYRIFVWDELHWVSNAVYPPPPPPGQPPTPGPTMGADDDLLLGHLGINLLPQPVPNDSDYYKSEIQYNSSLYFNVLNNTYASLTLDITPGFGGAIAMFQDESTLTLGNFTVGFYGAAQYNMGNSGPVPQGGVLTTTNLTLGVIAGGTGIFSLAAGNLTVNGTETIGVEGVGIFTQSGGFHTVHRLVVNPNGTFQMSAGALAIDGNSIINGNLTCSGGDIHITDGQFNVNTSVVTAAFSLSGGAIGGSGTLTANGPLNITGGELFSDTYITVVANGGMNIQSSGTFRLWNASLTNAAGQNAVINLTGPLNIELESGSVFANAGTLTATGGQIYGGGGTTVNNSGVFNIDLSSSNANFTIENFGSYTFFNNTGVVNVHTGILEVESGISTGAYHIDSGATLFLPGNFTISPGATFTGAGTILVTGRMNVTGAYGFTGTTIINGDLQVNSTNATATALSLIGGAIGGSGTLTANGPLNITGGELFSDTYITVVANGGMNIQSSGTFRLWNASLTNAAGQNAVINLTGPLNIELESGSVFANAGTLTATGGQIYGGGGTTVNNSGVFNIDLSSSNANFTIENFGSYTFFNNTGVVNVHTGILEVESGISTGAYHIDSGATLFLPGNFTISPGATFTGAGTILVTGRMNVTGAYGFTGTTIINGDLQVNSTNATATALSLIGGAIGGSGTLTANGPLNITGGELFSDTYITVVANGGMNIQSSGTFRLWSASLTNAAGHNAVINPTGPLIIELESGSVFANAGTLTATGGQLYGGGGTTFNNSGVFNIDLSSSSAIFYIGYSMAFNNTGVVNVHTGIVNISDAAPQLLSNTLIGGYWNVFNNATLNLPSLITTNQAHVALNGPNSSFPAIAPLADNQGSFFLQNGRIFTTDGDLLNSGTINIDATSSLIITGNYTQAATGMVTGTGSLAINGTFSVNPTNAITIPNKISGTGGLTHLGPGTTTLTGLYSATGPINMSAGKLVFATTNAPRQTPAALLTASSLSLFASTTLDTTNHDLMLGNSDLLTIQAQILKGLNKPSNSNAAITSSTALSDGNTFLVPFDADQLLGNGNPGSAIGYIFDGVAITQPHTILVKYAYLGDITLDGKIDGLDLATAAGNYSPTVQTTPGLADISASWRMGDINLDGFVDDTDFQIMSTNAAISQLSPLGALNLTPVPEPSSLALLALALPALLTRRKPRHRHSHLTT